MKTKNYDLIIIGGGVMGLMTAYYASQYTRKILILERSRVGNKKAASSGLARSIRSDYLDPLYGNLADESKKLWQKLEVEANEKFYIRCGLLNIANTKVSENLRETYAYSSFTRNNNFKLLNSPTLLKRFPQFKADLGCLDPSGGLLLPQQIMEYLQTYLVSKGVVIQENAIPILSEKIPTVVTAGIGTGELLGLPIEGIRPEQSSYYLPPNDNYTTKNLPVFAYLDIGIYGHPIVVGTTKYLKIGFYTPQNYAVQKWNPDRFMKIFFVDGEKFKKVNIKSEQCLYDMTPDENFIVGRVRKNICVGAGFCGTGFKFAPAVGKQLASLALAIKEPYNMKQFYPARFRQKLLYSKEENI